ncbi:MAG: phosphonate ABC transporter, permease protein PhnE [Candidatus Sericytochromatia bacterium]|nr:phosphonate ABC transporter, permease protein PhnE [Candidatus Sericytochromatia bacterium]
MSELHTETRDWKNTSELRDTMRQHAPVPPKRGIKRFVLLLLGFLLVLWAFDGAKFRFTELFQGAPKIVETIGRMLPPDGAKIVNAKSYSLPAGMSVPELLLPMPLDAEKAKFKQRWWNNTFPQTIVGATIQTIQMALVGTVLAIVFAFPLAFLAAINTTPHPLVYKTVRFAINLLRTIPDLALGLIFVSAVGLGPFAGTLALAFHTTTVLTKLLSESIENIDKGVVEAIRATGAAYPQILSFAVVPQMLPDLISFSLYRFETNIRAAAILGLIGAGGIGYLLNTSFRTFQYQEASAIVVILIVLVMGVDSFSARLRKLVI